jgi:hypothetical protein
MASTIPESQVFSMLRKLPANSFVLKWRRVKPNVQIPSTGYELLGTAGSRKQDITLNINGAVNEMALMSHARVVVNMSANQEITAVAPATYENGKYSPLDKQNPFNHVHWKYAGGNIFASTREVFNAGSLCLYENCSADSLSAVNTLRGLCARRPAHFDYDEVSSNYDDVKVGSLCINDLESAGFSGYQKRMDGCGYQKTGANILSVKGYNNATNAVGPAVAFTNATDGFPRDCMKQFEFPLGQFSSLASTFSVIPLGTLSSFSVNGWAIEMQFDGSNAVVVPATSLVAGDEVVKTSTAIVNDTLTVKLHGVEIYYPTVTILNQEVMNGIISLYRKEASVPVGGVSIPMSLRMNTLNYRINTYSIQDGLNQYHIPSTEKSARALFYIIYDRESKARSGLTNNDAVNRNAETSSALQYPLSVKGITPRSIELRMGSDDYMPCVRNDSPDSGEVEAFIWANLKKAGATASPFPYWEEVTKNDIGYAEDILSNLRCKSTQGSQSSAVNVPNFNGYRTRNNASVQYGCFDFQNMDYRTGDSGSVASGKSLNNIGRYDVEMDFQSISQTSSGTNVYAPVVNATSKRIAFFEVYDEVIEASAAQGVQLITNAVLV